MSPVGEGYTSKENWKNKNVRDAVYGSNLILLLDGRGNELAQAA